MATVTSLQSLLRRFDALRIESTPNHLQSRVKAFGWLLSEFGMAARRVSEKNSAIDAERAKRFSAILYSFTTVRVAYYERQRATAEDFNLLAVLQLVGKEVRHSMMLAWLLDRDAAVTGSHAQGSLGFKIFLEEVGLPVGYAATPYYVRREVASDDSIIDVEIFGPGRFLIHIENKIWLSEGIDQTDREWDDLCRRARSVGLDPQSSRQAVHALYLTPRGSRPTNPNFHPISWKQVALILQRFAERA